MNKTGKAYLFFEATLTPYFRNDYCINYIKVGNAHEFSERKRFVVTTLVHICAGAGRVAEFLGRQSCHETARVRHVDSL